MMDNVKEISNIFLKLADHIDEMDERYDLKEKDIKFFEQFIIDIGRELNVIINTKKKSNPIKSEDQIITDTDEKIESLDEFSNGLGKDEELLFMYPSRVRDAAMDFLVREFNDPSEENVQHTDIACRVIEMVTRSSVKNYSLGDFPDSQIKGSVDG